VTPAPALVDPHGRRIRYLRLSVTDLCNLRCRYCMPAGGVRKLPKSELLSLEELYDAARVGVSLGIEKIRLTGGEPLVRRDLPLLIERLAALDGLRTLALTTNGLLLSDHAAGLARSGLTRVNVSLDAVEPQRFAELTRGGDLEQVVRGIDAASASGLPVKINTVLLARSGEAGLEELVRFAAGRGLTVRFIEEMTFGSQEPILTEEQAVARLRAAYDVEAAPVDPDQPHVRRYLVDGVTIGFISPRSHAFCDDCNRLRLTAQGQLRCCLASHHQLDLREVLRRPHDDRDVASVFARAVALKPACGPWTARREMWRVGG